MRGSTIPISNRGNWTLLVAKRPSLPATTVVDAVPSIVGIPTAVAAIPTTVATNPTTVVGSRPHRRHI
jgi:hypothetical protein